MRAIDQEDNQKQDSDDRYTERGAFKSEKFSKGVLHYLGKTLQAEGVSQCKGPHMMVSLEDLRFVVADTLSKRECGRECRVKLS